jgi:asparagine synthase (glutamine-hydrolysing)
MCGIAGAAWTAEGAPLGRDVLQRMTDALRHRGPDDEGAYLCGVRTDLAHEPVPGVALGFRRLSIIDVAGGRQPLANEDESVWLVFNGEIYNYTDLRRRLEGNGHTFRTHSDSETIVHLYEDEGTDCFRHLRGMFALALWDARHRQLVLARDRLGKKPLVYREEPGRLLFASELKAILQVPGVPREVDPAAVDEYLVYKYVPPPNTILRGVRKLLPAHYAVWRDGQLSTGCYWTPDFQTERRRPRADYIDELRRTLATAVELRLQSDVPLGAFLSGGTDSSIVVALMKQASGERVKTFSIGFPVPEYDETGYAREVARHLDTDHHEFRVEPDGMEVLPKLVWHYDEPFADSSAVPTYYVSRMTREHVTVALTGDGGDELFAGYPRYSAVRMGECLDRLPGPLRGLISARFWQRLPASPRQKSVVRRLKQLSAAMDLSPARRYFNWITTFREAHRAALYTEDFLARLPDSDPFHYLGRAWDRPRGRDHVTRASLADVVTYLPGDLMTKVDMASMAASLECRCPFLDHHVVELAAGMPARLKLRRGRGKLILLEAFGHLLPKNILHRRKMGFAVPLDHWFRRELAGFVRQVLLDPPAAERGYFRPEAVRGLIDEHQSGRIDHSYRLWALLFFELWCRQWLD